MRLTCPNCNAQYEVPEDVIPDRGRDVQCSNCEHTWFQSKELEPEPVPDVAADPLPDTPTPEPDGPNPEPQADFETELETALGDIQPDVAPEPLSEIETAPEPKQETDESQTDPVMPRAPKRELDPEVASVLREEAEREKKARQADALEYQPDLGIDQQEFETVSKPQNGDDTVFFEPKLDELEELYDQGTQEDEGRKRNELQDVDELNSTLLGDDRIDVVEKIEDPAPEDTGASKSNSRSGFIFAFVILALLLWLYANAQAVGQAVPQIQGILSIFVGIVDGLRSSLNGIAQMVMGLFE